MYIHRCVQAMQEIYTYVRVMYIRSSLLQNCTPTRLAKATIV